MDFFNLCDGKGWGTGNLTSTTIPLGPLGLPWSDLTALKGVIGPTRLLYRWYVVFSTACNAGVFWGRANAIAAILDFKRRGRLGRVERTTRGRGNPPWRLRSPRFWHSRVPKKTPALQTIFSKPL